MWLLLFFLTLGAAVFVWKKNKTSSPSEENQEKSESFEALTPENMNGMPPPGSSSSRPRPPVPRNNMNPGEQEVPSNLGGEPSYSSPEPPPVYLPEPGLDTPPPPPPSTYPYPEGETSPEYFEGESVPPPAEMPPPIDGAGEVEY